MKKLLVSVGLALALSSCTNIGTSLGPFGPALPPEEQGVLCWPALDHTIQCGSKAAYDYARDNNLIGELSHGGVEDQPT